VKNGTSGESCKGTALENGNIKITCGTTVVGELKKGTNGTNGKSAYELSGFEGTEAEWLASLKGAAGENCTVADVEGGVKVTCNGVSKTVLNGTDGDDGDDGTSCTITGDKDGKVTLACGEGESVVETTLYKAVCGTTPYDPAAKFCFNMELIDLCNGEAFDPTKFKCVENQLQEKVPEEKCGEATYNPKKEFCATRNNVVERIYKKVIIGEGENAQTWMAENLNYATAEGSTCSGNNDDERTENCATYGRLYTWAVATEETTCPDGWHLPSKTEFEKLITNVDADLNGSYNETNKAGTALKSTSGWNENGNGTNASGFSALPGGFGTGSTSFMLKGNGGYFWSSSKVNDNYSYGFSVSSTSDVMETSFGVKEFYYSVRCVQNDPQ